MSLGPSVVILAAGMGSRYGGLKQVDPIGPSGEVVLDFSVFDAIRAGFGKVTFVIRKEMEESFRSTVGSRFENRVEVGYAIQELDKVPAWFKIPAGRRKPWGTGHALLCAEHLGREPMAVINADDFYGAESFAVMGEFLRERLHQPQERTYAMVGYRLEATLSPHGSVARGLCQIDRDGWLTHVEELTGIEKTASGARNKEAAGDYRELNGHEVVSLNLWGFTPAIFEQLQELFGRFLKSENLERGEIYLSSSVNTLIEEGQARVKVLPTNARWFGITYREDRAGVVENIRELVRGGAYPERLWG